MRNHSVTPWPCAYWSGLTTWIGAVWYRNQGCSSTKMHRTYNQILHSADPRTSLNDRVWCQYCDVWLVCQAMRGQQPLLGYSMYVHSHISALQITPTSYFYRPWPSSGHSCRATAHCLIGGDQIPVVEDLYQLDDSQKPQFIPVLSQHCGHLQPKHPSHPCKLSCIILWLPDWITIQAVGLSDVIYCPWAYGW